MPDQKVILRGLIRPFDMLGTKPCQKRLAPIGEAGKISLAFGLPCLVASCIKIAGFDENRSLCAAGRMGDYLPALRYFSHLAPPGHSVAAMSSANAAPARFPVSSTSV